MNRLAIIFLITAISGCTNAQESYYTNLTSAQFKEKISKAQATVLDVRTSGEFSNGHIFGAGQLNYYALDFSKKLLLLPKDQPVFIYCNTGWRSKKAAEILSENGYTQLYNLEKGIMEWELNDFQVVIEPNAKLGEVDKMEPDEFYALVNSDIPVFIDFYAPWCAPCREMIPLIDSLQTEHKDKITIVKINADASKSLVKQLKLGSVPYFAAYQSGVKSFEHFGMLTRKEFERILNR